MRILSKVCLWVVTTMQVVAGEFEGSLTFSQTASGAQEKLVNGVMASEVKVFISKESYRQDEIGGANAGSYLVRKGAPKGLKIDRPLKEVTEGIVTSLDAQPAEVRQYMTTHFTTGMEAAGEKATIAGYETEKYRVTKSAFLRPGATVEIWIAKVLEIGRNRYDFNFPASRVTSPLPLSLPLEKGTVLKSVVVENGTTVTTIATEVKVGPLAAGVFEKPAGFPGPDLAQVPVAPKVLPAPKREKVDLAGLPPTLELSGIKFILVKPGTFQMGSKPGDLNHRPDERQHSVTLAHPYYLSVTEVNRIQWKKVTGSSGPGKFSGGYRPIENLTWEQARGFCKKLSEKSGYQVRLPTEAEWEYAARAGGENIPPKNAAGYRSWLQKRSWMSDNAEYKTHKVGQLAANPWGFHDMLGNVGEWTLSGYAPYPESAESLLDPQGTDDKRKVVRGGAWVESVTTVRPTHRSYQQADTTRTTIGFRVVAEAK